MLGLAVVPLLENVLVAKVFLLLWFTWALSSDPALCSSRTELVNCYGTMLSYMRAFGFEKSVLRLPASLLWLNLVRISVTLDNCCEDCSFGESFEAA